MVVIIDPQNAGIAGNMMVGALLDLGADREATQSVMEYFASYFGDLDLETSVIEKSGIKATYVDVKCEEKAPIMYKELLNDLDSIHHQLVTPNILDFAKKVFKTLAEAEAAVHGTTLDKVHFHEVGAADAVADIIGSAYAFQQLRLNKKKIYGLPVALGGGSVETRHGRLGLPAPATLEILKGVPVVGGPVYQELTTPTGAALLVNLVDEFSNFYPPLTSRKVGYGAGTLELPFPNVLRILVGDSPLPTDQVTILETNLDNVTGEVLGHSFKSLMDGGALDVTIIPTITKKNRPGHLLRVIVKPGDCDAVSKAIIRETGTLGVRVLPYVHRNIAERKIVPVEIDMAGIKRKIRIKVGLMGEEIISVKPEYEDALKVAEETGMPLKTVMKKAKGVFKEMFDVNK
jgi:pyridinium-3,5-bisthiocarboxylic acid mononucleotide nickel chelatase